MKNKIFIAVGIILICIISFVFIHKNKKDNYLTAADYVFEMIDDGTISVFNFYDEDSLTDISGNSKLNDIIKNDINFYSLKVGSKDVIFFVTGGHLKNAEGYVIVRNGAKPAEKYPEIGFGDRIHYEKIADRMYSFDAALP